MVAIPAGETRLDYAVDQDAGASDLQQMPGHPDCARQQQRKFVGDVTGQRAQPHSFGADVGTPSRTSGRAVTGPTHIACTLSRNAESTRSSMPISVARINTDATAGADVKLTASNFSSAIPATS